MKNLTLLAVLAILVLSCGSPKKTTETQKTSLETKKVMEGNWTLNAINFSEEGNFLISILSDTSKECFEGSSWNFTPESNAGTYTIANNDCPNGERTFRYIGKEADPSTGYYDFQLKLTGEKHKSDKSPGFALHLSKLTNSSMKWEQTVTLQGKPITIEMNFSKN